MRLAALGLCLVLLAAATGPARAQTVDEVIAMRAAVERRLARIPGHDSAKASVRWPFDVARLIKQGSRKLGSNDFGLREDGTQTFDFAKEVRVSAGLLDALEQGKDPLFRATGDHERHYFFETANEIMPYRVYVPTAWDGRAKLRMLLVLHGNTRDHDFYFDRDGGMLARLAEAHNWLVVCPLGYRPNAGYNASASNDPARQREGALSEQDVINVFDLVKTEYPVDRGRVYLFGHSAGGTGGWHIGTKYADRFAGLAISAAGTRPDGFPFDKVKDKALMVIVGSKDDPGTVALARQMAKALREHGHAPQFLEIAGATHTTVVGLAEPRVLDFFDQHSKRRQRP